MSATHTTVLRETTVQIKVCGFDLVYRRVDQSTEFFPLFFGNCCSEVLDLGMVLTNEDDKGNTLKVLLGKNSRAVVGRATASLQDHLNIVHWSFS